MLVFVNAAAAGRNSQGGCPIRAVFCILAYRPGMNEQDDRYAVRN